MFVSIRMLHQGALRDMDLRDGSTVADALVKLGYPRLGHRSWRAWVDGREVPLNTYAPKDVQINISHVTMGEIGKV